MRKARSPRSSTGAIPGPRCLLHLTPHALPQIKSTSNLKGCLISVIAGPRFERVPAKFSRNIGLRVLVVSYFSELNSMQPRICLSENVIVTQTRVLRSNLVAERKTVGEPRRVAQPARRLGRAPHRLGNRPLHRGWLTWRSLLIITRRREPSERRVRPAAHHETACSGTPYSASNRPRDSQRRSARVLASRRRRCTPAGCKTANSARADRRPSGTAAPAARRHARSRGAAAARDERSSSR
jgi:hypothetical protein